MHCPTIAVPAAPLCLQEILDQVKCGARGLPTYAELEQLDTQIAERDARIAQLSEQLSDMRQYMRYMATTMLQGAEQ